MSTNAEIRRRTWKARVFRAGEESEAEISESEYWTQVPIHERAELAWQLSKEIWSLSQPDRIDEQRFSRSFARVIRR
ncbi:MAG: hypothetical protein GY847_06950 [Proteobacteria bacterium]|nr:hypothetical protein [Pseudomonadota bacterium]